MNPSPQRPLAILVHGMGRTPVSMALLALRLRRAGFDTALFGYLVTFEKLPGCVARLQRFIDTRCDSRPYIVMGHSLGGVLLRCALPRLMRQPAGCFLLAAPSRACELARRVARLWPYRLFTGEMGRLLADEKFMAGVPIPDCPAWVYAGTGGPTSRFFLLGDEPNDGILRMSETQVAGVPTVCVPAMHTFFMNSRALARDLIGRAVAVVGRAS